MTEDLEVALRRTLLDRAESIDERSLRPSELTGTSVTFSLAADGPPRYRRRAGLTVAALVLIIAGVGGLVVTRDPGSVRTPVTAGPATAPPTAPQDLRVWPLNGDAPLTAPSGDDPRTPDVVARRYLTEVIGLPEDWPIHDLSTQEGTSVVDFVVQDVPAQLMLRRDDESGSWYITGATTDLMRPALVAVSPQGVEVSLRSGPRTFETGVEVRLTAVAADGSVLATTETSVASATSTGAELLRWSGQELAAVVRADALDDHDSDPSTPPAIIGHWTTGVPAPTAEALPPSCDPAMGEAVFEAGGSADDVASAYLRARFPDYPAPGVKSAPARTRGARAFVAWSVEEGIAHGDLFLKRTPTGWGVVASTTAGVDLSEVHVDRDRIIGRITTTNVNSLYADVLRPDGTPVPGAPRPKGQPGAAYRFATAGGPGHPSIDLDVVTTGESPTIRVGLVGGTILSVTECRPSAG